MKIDFPNATDWRGYSAYVQELEHPEEHRDGGVVACELPQGVYLVERVSNAALRHLPPTSPRMTDPGVSLMLLLGILSLAASAGLALYGLVTLLDKL